MNNYIGIQYYSFKASVRAPVAIMRYEFLIILTLHSNVYSTVETEIKKTSFFHLIFVSPRVFVCVFRVCKQSYAREKYTH